MIKALITELLSEKTSLTEALTKAKVIASKVKDDKFKEWMNSELLGYDYNNKSKAIPNYRVIKCKTLTQVTEINKKPQTFPVDLNEMDEETKELYTKAKIIRSVTDIEDFYKAHRSNYVILPETFDEPHELKEAISEGFVDEEFVVIINKEVHAQDLKKIVDITRQSLLDTLLELYENFPDLENDFKMTDDKIKRVHNIVTTNIYGDSHGFVQPIGETITLKDISINITNNDFVELQKLGVDDEHIEEIKTIIDTPSQNKKEASGKVMKWLGSVSSSIAAKGLYDNFPAIIDFVHRLLH